ncbi:MAG: VWA domain-containing protein [Bryobacterales bacterium]|nr:VWA domain-containing protein [Bryobacterales bacterium]
MKRAVFFLAFAASAQEAPTFRSGVTLVRVDAQVVGRNGRTIDNLTADDFAVFDEGKQQTIVHFGRESEPLDLLLLLDVSGSMSRSLQLLAAAARGALKQLYPSDRVSVMLFARRAEVREDFTSDFTGVAEWMRDAVLDKSLGAGTAINQAIVTAAAHIGKQPVRGRRAILIVTDNQSLNYQVTDEDALRALYGADAVLNAIVIGPFGHPAPPVHPRGPNPDFTPSDVLKLAQQTGGEALAGGKIGETFFQMVERIRARYNIQYVAPAPDAAGFRRISVELKAQKGLTVRARAGYYATR